MIGRSQHTVFILLSLMFPWESARSQDAARAAPWPPSLRVVLENTPPLEHARGDRLPLLVLPISGSLANFDDEQAAIALRELDRRGIGYTVDWSPADFEKSLAEGLRIGRLQQRFELQVAINANACLYSFFDGSDATLHVDASGHPFGETSFGGELGCPFALEHRIPVIKERIESFLQAYREAGIRIDIIFADWEVDGPIEWNDALKSSQRCTRCRKHIPGIADFRQFQNAVRNLRSELQRVTFGDNVTTWYPEALVGNYGVYPHDGYRYWYDYFERLPEGAPYRSDQRARYREWAHEFDATGYTFAMPVVYTWYSTFDWYDFSDADYRWFYNMLLVGSNAGRHTPASVPIIPFVHWTTTSPPQNPDPHVRQFSAEKYQELLWHLLLRGHDTFFLWCTSPELAREIQLVHRVYADALAYRGFFERGTPVNFVVPPQPDTVISGMRLGKRVLVRRTDFGDAQERDVVLRLEDNEQVVVRPQVGPQILEIQRGAIASGLISDGERIRFAIGSYELPEKDGALKEMAANGFNLVKCNERRDLDRARDAGLLGWVPLNVQQGATDALRIKVESVADHPAVAVWEGPDEIVWTFTAYSGLANTAGFTRSDWERQAPEAVAYAREQAATIIPNIHAGIALVRKLDDRNLPFWINEAADSDLNFVRQYVDAIDITGCDYYAIRSGGSDLNSIGRLVERWTAAGRGKPVWMVLQGFSWHTMRPDRGRRYPTFAESRYMAYDAIVRGARGLLYWGTWEIDEPAFRRSLYALTAELAKLQPFLVRENQPQVDVVVVDDLFDPPGNGVRAILREAGGEWLIVLVNQDPHRHLGVDVRGLGVLERRQLELLYGDERVSIQQGGFVTRLQEHEVKVFCTDRQRFSTDSTDGRRFGVPR